MLSHGGQGFFRGGRGRILSRLSSALRPEVPRLGIDIGSHQIKVVECLVRDRQLRVRNTLCFDTPAQAVSAYAVHDIEAVAHAIRANLDRAPSAAGRAIASIPGPSAMVKRFNIGVVDTERLEEVVRSEVENLAPAASGALSVDYQVCERADEDGLEVVVVAARFELVASYVRTLECAGLVAEAVDVDSLALANVFEANHGFETSSTVALIHVGARFASVIIHSHGRTMLVGDVPAGTGGAGGNDDAGDLAWADRVAAEIERALRFYWPVSAGDRIDEILLSGGAAREQRFVGALAGCTGCRVRVVDPFACMRDDVDRCPAIGPCSAPFAVAAGLAVRLLEQP